MISKELLSEVLDLKYPIRIIHHFCKGQNLLNYDLHVECALFQESINIYELAHKCKEWAIDSQGGSAYFMRSGNYVDWFCETGFTNGFDTKKFTADTEPEAIFKSCEWILKDKR